MCGILGTTGEHKGDIGSALQSLAHRGPDQRGTFADRRVALGHCRLSIIDLTEAGRQPLTDRTGNLVLTYNGEIYNYEELKRSLQKEGIQFKTKTDTEVILEGYAREGVSFFEKLRGMWAFALYDKQQERIILSRDRFGIKPLYYTLHGGTLAFASEMKALKQLGVPLEANTEAFFTFFNLGYFIAPATCYRSILSLQPGEMLTYQLADKKISSNFLASARSGAEGTEDERQAVDILHTVLLESVRAHFVADVPVGLLFSGGNDSSLIAALSREAGYDPQAYHLSVEGSSDTGYAQRIAKELNLKSEIIPMNAQELIWQYEAVWDILDVPFADVSIIPTSLIYKKIAGRSKVVLSGEGGDEWFGGYPRHSRLAPLRRIAKENKILELFGTLQGSSATALAVSNPLVQRVRNAYLALGDDVIGTYLVQAKTIDYPLSVQQLRAKLFGIHAAAGEGALPPNLFFDAALYLPNDLLFKNDIASMASSIEARVPLVDIEVFRAVQSISPALRLSARFREKYLLKKILERYLPEELIYRDKRGFGFSFERYRVPQFEEDVRKAVTFHSDHAETFGLSARRGLLQEKHAGILIKKYPRFAFGLVSNWKVFK